MDEKPHSRPVDTHAAIERLLAVIDRVLEQGRAAQERCDQFRTRHGLEPGCGERLLTADVHPPAQRYIHRRLLELNAELYARFLSPPPTPVSPPSTAAARAVGSRIRI